MQTLLAWAHAKHNDLQIKYLTLKKIIGYAILHKTVHSNRIQIFVRKDRQLRFEI